MSQSSSGQVCEIITKFKRSSRTAKYLAHAKGHLRFCCGPVRHSSPKGSLCDSQLHPEAGSQNLPCLEVSSLQGSENLSHLPLGGLANPGADPWNGFLEERSRASRKTREGFGRERDGAAPKTPARVDGPGSEWPARVGWAHPEGQGGVCLGLEAGARGLRSGARVTCEEGRKSPKRGACCELGVLGAPRAAGARAPGRAGDAAGTGSQTEGAAAGVGGTATEKDTAGRFVGRDWAGAGIREQRRGPQPCGRRGGTETLRRGPCSRREVATELGDPRERVAGLWVTAGGGAPWAPGPHNLSPGFMMLPPGQRPALGAGQR